MEEGDLVSNLASDEIGFLGSNSYTGKDRIVKRGIRSEPVAKRHRMVSSTLAPLYTVFGLKLGCSGAAAPIGDEVL